MAEETRLIEAQSGSDCPFCEGAFHATIFVDGDCQIVHTTPPCKEFEDQEIDDFLFNANNALAARKGLVIVRGIHE